MSVYMMNFKSREDMAHEFGGDEYQDDKSPSQKILADLVGSKMHVAWYGSGSYCGSSFVLYEKNGKLFEVNGSHCSCYGLEGQWKPEETSWKALAWILDKGTKFQEGYDGAEEVDAKMRRIVAAHLEAA